MGIIAFIYEKAVSISSVTKLKKFLHFLCDSENKSLERLNYIFCDDDKILEINTNFLTHYYATDVITFSYAENDKFVIGDIYISIDSVKINSIQYNNSFSKELYRVMFHGLLHLCGYNDQTIDEKQLMTEKENFYLNKYKAFHVKQKI